jgi:hypothetical protein
MPSIAERPTAERTWQLRLPIFVENPIHRMKSTATNVELAQHWRLALKRNSRDGARRFDCFWHRDRLRRFINDDHSPNLRADRFKEKRSDVASTAAR